MAQTFTSQVKIGPRFFAQAFKDYSDPKWAFVREIMQNSIDSGASEIRVNVQTVATGENSDTVIVVSDNGRGMNREVLESKLLSLGGSGKEFAGTVGGFGKAKEILYFAQKSYRIDTQNWVVQGSGADYSITESEKFNSGCTSLVTWNGVATRDLTRVFGVFASYLQWSGKLYLNEDLLSTDLRKGSPRREFGFGKVYTNKTFPNTLIVRIQGIPMFVEYTGFNGCVLVELDGPSDQILTANRDGLTYEHRRNLQNFIAELSIDKKSALRNREAKYVKYAGNQLTHSVSSTFGAALQESLAAFLESPTTPQAAPSAVKTENRPAEVSLGFEFIVKNETGLDTPSYYLPDSADFGNYSRSLAKMWAACMVELHRMFDHPATFSVGFVLSEDCEAQFENGEFGSVYYLNPIEVVTQKGSSSRSFKKRFKLTEHHRILACAVHEYVHGLGYSLHDENYAGALTGAFQTVLKNSKRFNACFR